MCTSRADELITETVEDLIEQDQMFTALDVSRKVQKSLLSEDLPYERHNGLKGTIHRAVDSYVSQGVYERTLQDVGAKTAAFVYFATGSDSSGYTPLPRDDKPKTVSTIAVAAVAAAVDDTDDGDCQASGRKADHRGTLTVPAYLLQAAGINPGEKASAFAVQENGKPTLHIAVNTGQYNGVACQTKYTVDKYFNVRVNAAVLAIADFDNDARYDFEQRKESVVISAH